MSVDRVIALIAAVGCLWLFSTANIWGPIVDNMECGAPKTAKRVQL